MTQKWHKIIYLSHESFKETSNQSSSQHWLRVDLGRLYSPVCGRKQNKHLFFFHCFWLFRIENKQQNFCTFWSSSLTHAKMTVNSYICNLSLTAMQNYQHKLSELGCTLVYKLDQNTIYCLLVNINALTSNPMF